MTEKLTELFVLVIIAAMWNALAGYAGLVSVGQQAFIGIGAYATIVFAEQGLNPFVSAALAALAAGRCRCRCRCSCSGCAAASSRSGCGWWRRCSGCSSPTTSRSAAAPVAR